jgi:hypothetical protein
VDDSRLHAQRTPARQPRRQPPALTPRAVQFEEIFTLCNDEHERAQFLSNLLYAAFIPGGRNAVVLTRRADFYQKCAAYPELSERIAANQFLVGPMNEENLKQAIEEPAWHVGLEFEQGLVETILTDIQSQPGALPLLEHALLELWERRRGSMLTLEAYRESGGVQGAIAKRADAIYDSFTPEQQQIVRHIMLRLTQPGEGTEDTRRRATMDEVVTRRGESKAVEDVTQTMANARLLTTDEEPGKQVVDVSHEALIRGWPRLRKWIEEDRAGLRILRRLTEVACEWQPTKDESLLYRGARLAGRQVARTQRGCAEPARARVSGREHGGATGHRAAEKTSRHRPGRARHRGDSGSARGYSMATGRRAGADSFSQTIGGGILRADGEPARPRPAAQR